MSDDVWKPIAFIQGLIKKLEALSGEQSVDIEEFLADDFICEHTDFQTRQDFLNAGGFESVGDFDTTQWSEFVAARTRFGSWQEMFVAAGHDWARRRLGL
jgi:hypothetical protein